MLRLLIEQMAQAQGITEQLKAENQMAWVGAVNNIRSAAEETTSKQSIYIWVKAISLITTKHKNQEKFI